MKQYYYLGPGQQQFGPMSVEELLRAGINGDTYVWCEGMPQWSPASQVPELASMLQSGQYHTSTPPPFAAQQHANPYSNYQPYGSNPHFEEPCPPTNLVWAILCTVLCCLPLGIVAIIKANEVKTLYLSGHLEEAKQASKSAMMWSGIGAAVGFVCSILYVIMVVFASAL